jgi:hypothetical protein
VGLQDGLEVGQRLGLVAERDAEDDDLGLRGRFGVLEALDAGSGDGQPGPLGRLLGAGAGTPATPQRNARPKPSAPVAPMIATGSLKGGEYMFRGP